jgi:3-deoxy-D-manno-octulosonic-acid transferase
MARFLYSLAILALLPWAVAHLLWRARRQPEYLRHWGERFARYGAASGAITPTIWLHAVSVGETRAAQPLVATLRERYPDHRILFTHMTPTGRATSEALFGDRVERIYLPYDTPWAMRRFLRHFRPRLGLIMETELWPNLVAACREESVPLLLVNARLSDRSARRYASLSALTREALASLTAIGAQSNDDAARLEALGGRQITVTGNLKFDIAVPAQQFELGAELRQLHGDRKTWLAASTREGEEALILNAWRRLAPVGVHADDAKALLVIVPRHPQRFADVAKLACESGYRVQLRSENTVVAGDTDVLIGDSMGEMFAYYASADLAFIGGSLLDFGSQNLIEAAACGTPILIGPSTRNFADAARAAVSCGAARTIVDADDLVRQVQELLADDALLQTMGSAGRRFAERHRGATARTMELLSRASR